MAEPGLGLVERSNVSALLTILGETMVLEGLLGDLEPPWHRWRRGASRRVRLHRRAHLNTRGAWTRTKAPWGACDGLNGLGVPPFAHWPTLQRSSLHDVTLVVDDAVHVAIPVIANEDAWQHPGAHIAMDVVLRPLRLSLP